MEGKKDWRQAKAQRSEGSRWSDDGPWQLQCSEHCWAVLGCTEVSLSEQNATATEGCEVEIGIAAENAEEGDHGCGLRGQHRSILPLQNGRVTALANRLETSDCPAMLLCRMWSCC